MSRKIEYLHDNWTFKNAKTENWKSATVPGCVQKDLMDHGQLPDLFYGNNEIKAHEIEDETWVYRTEFEFHKGLEEKVNLVFEGIDTVATIYLNGKELDTANNMFIAYTFDVTDCLLDGQNTIELHFPSQVQYARDICNKSHVKLRSLCHVDRSYIRKAQYSFGWDWGPKIVQVGLWKPVYIERIDGATLEDVYVSYKNGMVNVAGSIGNKSEQGVQLDIEVCLDGEGILTKEAFISDDSFSIDLEIPDAQLWYPRGYGKQPLYTFTLKIPTDEKVIKTGLREVELKQEPTEQGKSFIFVVNGVDVFAKGACWIPLHNLLPELTRDDYKKALDLACEAQYNMMRVWGGGIYEDPYFYERCDELGIMVWQDFMFACAQYPDEFEWFRENVKQEAIYVLKQLRNHCSIVLWCGNNENNMGFDIWWGNNDPTYLGNMLYKVIFPELCKEYMPEVPYWVSSPYGGATANAMEEGDRHNWDVWPAGKDYDLYLEDTSSFVSEFGHLAMPAWKTVESYTPENQRTYFSKTIYAHNKNDGGANNMMNYVTRYMGVPQSFKDYVILTQIMQAEAVRFGSEHWRCRRFDTSGILYWQFNDCWPGDSWSCLDFYFRKKALYYYTKRFFADVAAFIKYEDESFTVTVANDTLDAVEGKLCITAYDFDGTKRGSWTKAFTCGKNDKEIINQISIDDLQLSTEPTLWTKTDMCTTFPQLEHKFLTNSIVFVSLEAGDIKHTNYLTFKKPRELELHRPEISYACEGNTITLQAKSPALTVYVDTENDVDLSDNFITMEPNKVYTITCSDNPGNIEVKSLKEMISGI